MSKVSHCDQRKLLRGGTALALLFVALSAHADWLDDLRSTHHAPIAQVFAERTAALDAAFAEGCGAPAAQALNAATTAWETLNAVAVGPLIERRSARRIDFRPTRPGMITEAITRVEKLAAEGKTQPLDYIGTPAKGLPALAWLMNEGKAANSVPACAYARRLSGEVTQEATALAAAFAVPMTTTVEEALNQWLGGLERLRWAEMEKPVHAQKIGTKSALVIRRASDDLPRWQAMWAGLRHVAIGNSDSDPGALVTLLRQRNLAVLAERLSVATRAADAEMRRVEATQAASVLRATATLLALKNLAEDDIATALDVRIGFSDADGD